MGADTPSVVDMSDYNLIMGSRGYDMFNNALLREYEQLFKNPKTPDESFKQKSIEIMKGNELDIQITDRNRSYGDSRIYRYKINGESVLRFDQIPYPECCGIAIIKNFSANGDMQKADFLDAMDQFLADIKKNDRYSKVLFYTNAGSNGDKLFSMINGITILDPFRNKRSGNTLVGFEINLLGEYETIILEDDFDEEETDGEHDEDEEEEDNDPFGLIPDVLPQQAQPEAVRGERPTLGNGIMGQISPSSRSFYLDDPWESNF